MSHGTRMPDWPDAQETLFDVDDLSSDFDAKRRPAIAERLQREEILGRITCERFVGYVWWDRAGRVWCCDVYQHHASLGVAIANDLDGLLSATLRVYAGRGPSVIDVPHIAGRIT